MELDEIEGKLRRVRGEVEARKQSVRPRSLNFTTLYCNEVAPPEVSSSTLNDVMVSTGQSREDLPPTPASSLVTTTAVEQSPSDILVRHRPLSPPAARIHRQNSLRTASNNNRTKTPQKVNIYRQSSSISRQMQNKYFEKKSNVVSRICMELTWFLLGVRHLLTEVPLLVLLVWYGRFGILFYLTLIATLAPGLASLPAVIRSGGQSCLHRFVTCFAVMFRLESFLRLLELCIPAWRGGIIWAAGLAVVHAGAGSTPQILAQAAVLGWCARPVEIMPDITMIFHGMNTVRVQPPLPCDLPFPVMIVQGVTMLVSIIHVSWALAYVSRPRVGLASDELMEPALCLLLRRTSLVTGMIANVLLAGVRAALILVAISVGWELWHLAVMCGVIFTVRLIVDLVHWRRGGGPPDPYLIICGIVALDPSNIVFPQMLGRRCVMTALQNAILLASIATRTRGAEAALKVYRIGVLQAAATLVGMLFLAARMRWVHPSPVAPSPSEGGKCFTKRILVDEQNWS